jgi:hypothetical protein
MKNISEVMRQKEAEIQQLQKDLDVLRAAARLLNEEGETESPKPAAVPSRAAASAAPAPRETVLRQFP